MHSLRVVHNDYTIQFKNKWYQLNATQQTTVFKKDSVTIEEWLDDTLHMRLKETHLTFTELPARPKPAGVKVTALTREKPQWKPPAHHPWRKQF